MNYGSNLRLKIEEILNIRCVFPSDNIIDTDNNDISEIECLSARCMLEYSELPSVSMDRKVPYITPTTDDIIEDVIVKMFHKNIKSNDIDMISISIKLLFKKLYSNVPSHIYRDNINSSSSLYLEPRIISTSLHPGIAAIFSFVESEKEVLISQAYAKHSMLSLSRFHSKTTLSSPTLGRPGGIGSKDLRQRFILYQLLQVISNIHGQDLCVENLDPKHIMLDDDMWLTLPIATSERTCLSTILHSIIHDEENTKSEIFSGSIIKETIQNMCEKIYAIDRPVDYYEPITVQWANGKISNLEYLMAVNNAGGRSMVDPLYHPVLPWVTDFSVKNPTVVGAGLRDLSRTKFRINKGDQQLETTFKHSDPPHHVPESLSELTFYIYMARRTPMQVLRRVVRDVFIPEHYPQSIKRLYEWSPDESIPEFYTDSSVFTSIHTSVHFTDLELPSFASTPSEFIKYHRSILESDEVSSKLHLWIDLTFGYCLDGQAAINNMNVPLRHTLSANEKIRDSPHLDKHPGFIMLFSEPHPARRLRKDFNNPGVNSYNNNEETNQKQETDIWKLNESFDSELDSFLKLDSSNNKTSYTNQQFSDKFYKEVDESRSSISTVNSTNTSNQISTPGSAKMGDLTSVTLNGNNVQILSVNNSTRNAVKSLYKPHIDNGLMKLKLAPYIDLNPHESCKNKVKEMVNSVTENKFADRFGSFLQPVYYYPIDDKINSENINTSPVDIYNLKKAKKKKSKHLSKLLWDSEFASELFQISDNILDNQLSNNSILESILKDGIDSVLNNDEDKNDGNETEKKSLLKLSKSLTKEMQGEDMFAIGCIISEIFTGEPLMSNLEALQCCKDKTAAFKLAYRKTTNLPLVIRRLIAFLIQPNLQIRPKAKEILQACTMPDIDMWNRTNIGEQMSGGCDIEYVNFTPPNISPVNVRPITCVNDIDCNDLGLCTGIRVEMLYNYCGSLFPSYFNEAYTYIGNIKLCRGELDRMTFIMNNLDQLNNMPLEGLSLALPHILAVVGDSKPFKNTFLFPPHHPSKSIKNNNLLKEKLILDYSLLIDILGSRLGMEGTEKLLIPKVVEFINKLMSPESLILLLKSSLWNILIIRSGVRCFLRYFLPLLLTYLISGTLYNVSNGCMLYDDDSSPLWASLGTIEKCEWLHLLPLDVIRPIQQAAINVIVGLSEAISLGHGLCARYILPSLLCLVGVPSLAAAGYGIKGIKIKRNSIDDNNRRSNVLPVQPSLSFLNEIKKTESNNDSNNSENSSFDQRIYYEYNETYEDLPLDADTNPDSLDAFVLNSALLDPQNMYVVRAIVELSMKLGENVITEVVLVKIFNILLPDLEILLTNNPSSSVIAAYMEIILLLNGILPSLSPEIVQAYYLNPLKTSAISLPKLLVMIPYSPCLSLYDSFTSNCIKDVDLYILHARRNSLFLEICRLIVSSSMMSERAVCISAVLPYVDQFFGIFIEAHRNIFIESKTMNKGFELGSELFIPLQQLAGPEAFATTVPNVNPKLELWLQNIGSGGPRSSPPLPSTIIPDEERNDGVNNDVDRNKRKGFRHSIREWLTSSHQKVDPVIKPNSLQHYDAYKEPLAININKTNLVSSYQQPPSSPDEYSPVAQRFMNTDNTINTPLTTSKNRNLTSNVKSATEGMELKAFESTAKKNALAKISSPQNHLADSLAINNYIDSPVADVEQSSHQLTYDNTQDRDSDDSAFRDSDDDITIEENEFNLDKSIESPPLIIRISDDEEYSGSQNFNQIEEDVEENKDLNVNNISSVVNSNIPLPSSFVTRLITRSEAKGLTYDNKKDKSNNIKGSSSTFGKVKELDELEKADEEAKNIVENDLLWLLSGKGRWNIQSEINARSKYLTDDSKREDLRLANNSLGMNLNASVKNKSIKSNWIPASQISMTVPRVVVDVSLEAGNFFPFTMTMNGQWNIEKDGISSIKTLAVNSTESLLLSSSKSGVKIWSLNSHPIRLLSNYDKFKSYDKNTPFPPFCAGFMRNNLHAATCDGNINVWDIEYCKTLAFLGGSFQKNKDIQNIYSLNENKGIYSFMSVISPRVGITPSVGAYGDNQILTCTGMTLGFFDFRCSNGQCSLKGVSEWTMNSLAIPVSTFGSSTIIEPTLTYATTSENYVCTGSSTGGMWVVDRRMGKVMQSWQASDSAILKIGVLSDHHIATISERNSSIWDFLPKSGDKEVKKYVSIKNMPEQGLNQNTILLNKYDQSSSNQSMYSDLGISTSALHVLYCFAGNKLYAGKMPSFDDKDYSRDRDNYPNMQSQKENIDEELKLTQSYFTDKNNVKVNKNKLNITSVAILPLRRLILLGTDLGQIKVIS